MNGRDMYQCSLFLRYYSQQQLILPYAVSDYSSTYAVVDLAELISALKRSQQRQKKAWEFFKTLYNKDTNVFYKK
jgi:hypothetical protein